MQKIALILLLTFAILNLAFAESSNELKQQNSCESDALVLKNFSEKWKNKKGKGYWAEFDKIVLNHNDCSNEFELYTVGLMEHWDSIEEISSQSQLLRDSLQQYPNATLSNELDVFIKNAKENCPASLKDWCLKFLNDSNKALAELKIHSKKL